MDEALLKHRSFACLLHPIELLSCGGRIRTHIFLVNSQTLYLCLRLSYTTISRFDTYASKRRVTRSSNRLAPREGFEPSSTRLIAGRSPLSYRGIIRNVSCQRSRRIAPSRWCARESNPEGAKPAWVTATPASITVYHTMLLNVLRRGSFRTSSAISTMLLVIISIAPEVRSDEALRSQIDVGSGVLPLLLIVLLCVCFVIHDSLL